jgi:hypothetical protein
VKPGFALHLIDGLSAVTHFRPVAETAIVL